jgi:acetoacetyl-CoA reductase
MMRCAVVTGGVGGIGTAIIDRLDKDGMRAIAVDISREKIDAYRGATGRPAFVCDVSSFEDVQLVFSEIERTHGAVDVVVNNAGITRDGLVHKMDFATQWQAVLSVNLNSAFNTVRYLASGMGERKWGRIVNISSMNGQRGQFGQSNYAAAKAGMIGFTKSIALEMASKGVTANCIAPGFILTDMTRAMKPEVLEQEKAKIPTGFMGEPGDIAAAVAFLASDDARFITGHVLAVNGGQYM